MKFSPLKVQFISYLLAKSAFIKTKMLLFYERRDTHFLNMIVDSRRNILKDHAPYLGLEWVFTIIKTFHFICAGTGIPNWTSCQNLHVFRAIGDEMSILKLRSKAVSQIRRHIKTMEIWLWDYTLFYWMTIEYSMNRKFKPIVTKLCNSFSIWTR